jgi:metallophosphoesterase (TIGR03767 family)
VRHLIGATALVAVIVSAAAGAAIPRTPRPTILDTNGDNRLEAGPREGFATRTELAPANPSRTNRELVTFGHVTDTQLVDEESPARVEFVDRIGEVFERAAYRPDEGLMPQVLSEQVRALRALALDVVVTTGDNVDNAQLNETRAFIDVMDGGLVNPDSGRRGTCGSRQAGPRYAGVRGGGRYYEPDRAGDGPGYAAAQTANRRRAGRSSALRDYPGLFERMNMRFRSPGLDVPWYSVFGNHDALAQGNLAPTAFFSQVAAGCKKVADLSARAWGLIRPLVADGRLQGDEREQLIRILYGDVLQTLADPKTPKRLWRMVPRDPARLLVSKARYMQEHFRTRGRPVGHGYSAENVARGEGYYAFGPRPGVRFVALDTVAENGPNGNVDEAQFRWLDGQLQAAEAARELVVVFGHHSLRTTDQGPASGAPPVHYGLGSCESPAPEPLRCLFRRHRAVIAYVAGHEHRNRIEPHETFWEIVTASHIDWPQQSRVVSVTDNDDGTVSILTHVLDTAAPPRPPRPPRPAKPIRGVLRPAEVARLASIARELAFNDPQAETGEDGSDDRSGTPLDRNAELLVRRP